MAFHSYASEEPFKYTVFTAPKESRWSSVTDPFTNFNGEKVAGEMIGSELPEVIPPGLSEHELRVLEANVRIHDISQKMSLKVFTKYDMHQPDPPGEGITSTHIGEYQRCHSRLANWRHDTVEYTAATNHLFKMPTDVPPRDRKLVRKVFFDHIQAATPNVNFVGLLIGPGGSTLRALEHESGAKISIRGRGASKEAHGRAETDEGLHVLIRADTVVQMNRAVETVQKRLVPMDDSDNALKQQQLRQLSINKGTYEGRAACAFCGSTAHPSDECEFKPERTGDVRIEGETTEDAAFAALLDDVAEEGDEALPWQTEEPADTVQQPTGAVGLPPPPPPGHGGIPLP